LGRLEDIGKRHQDPLIADISPKTRRFLQRSGALLFGAGFTFSEPKAYDADD
jgi:hypothetical protein